ncbi:MAG: EamA family transporter RarD, partial [Hyphomonadaceae bacterium]|nr:EamA family transporter RarD [Hyphomonadaceae bacterium]
LSAVFITGNWGLYVWAVAHDHVIEASLAYFLVPLVSVAFGVLLFGEPITRLQFGALALAGVGIAAQAAAIGAFPWVALALCLSWSLYSLVRKQAPVPAAGGLLAETMILAPAAAVGLWWLARQPEGVAFGAGATPSLLLGLLGVVTAAPLILFAFGARRLRFSTLGMLQFIAPSLQFLIGVAWGEPLTPLRLFSFAVIWAGLAIYTWDAIARERRLAAAAPSRASTASPGSAE